MTYKAVIFRKVSGEDFASDVLIDMLGDAGYEAFEETDEGLVAYCTEQLYSQSVLDDILGEMKTFADYKYAVRQMADRNWNKLWETTGYKPIDIDECHIHASNTPVSAAKYDILIDPDQSFGTGYHATTQMMLKLLMHSDLDNRSLLDVGCGTAILSIMASKRGATRVEGVDIDERAAENAKQNLALNGVNAKVYTGTIEAVAGQKYNYVLANINKNTLIDMMPQLVGALDDVDGTLLLSGFYDFDIEDIVAEANNYGVRLVKQLNDADAWSALVLTNK